MLVIIVVMFLGNSVYGSLMSTGAFEVYLDSNLIFSKLQTGAMPNMQDIERFLAWFNDNPVIIEITLVKILMKNFMEIYIVKFWWVVFIDVFL